VPADQQEVEPPEVFSLLARVLAALDEPTRIATDGIYLVRWPSVRISLERAFVFRPAPEQEAWTAWVDLTWTYNVNLPFTAAKAHFIGLGRQSSDAVADAVESWGKAAAPALISYIYGQLKAGADTWPVGDARSIGDRACITGPYLLRGDTAQVPMLSTFLQEFPLAAAVREHLSSVLKNDAPLHTVALYRAASAAGIHADVLIDNQLDERAGELLKQAHWPEPLETSNFLSVRHFLLCVKPVSEQSSAAGVGPLAATTKPVRKRRVFALVLLALLSAGLTYLLHEAFVSYSSSVAPAPGEAAHLLVPPSSFWYVPAALLGFLLSSLVIATVVVQENTSDLTPLWRNYRPLLLTGFAVAALAVILVYFAAHSYLMLTSEGLVLRRIWSFETERYPYSRVIALSETGSQGGNGAFSISLRDAEAWTTRREVVFPNDATKQYLGSRTGLRITTSDSP
jgi:hypothetical protein